MISRSTHMTLSIMTCRGMLSDSKDDMSNLPPQDHDPGAEEHASLTTAPEAWASGLCAGISTLSHNTRYG